MNARDPTCVVTLTMNPALDVFTSTGEMAPKGKVRCEPPRHEPGGGGILVARLIHRMGGAVRAVFTAGGFAGTRLTALLRAEGVPLLAVESHAETRECFNVIDAASGRCLRFVLPGEPLLEREWRDAIERACGAAGDCKWLVASGSLPPGVPADLYARLAARARKHEGRLVLDAPPSLAALALREGGLHIVNADAHLLREFTGQALESTESQLDAARALTAAGASEIVVLQAGGEGTSLVTREQVLRGGLADGPTACEAGGASSFLAGLVQSLIGGRDLRAAFATGLAAGAAVAVAPPGSLADAAQIERLREQVWIR